VLRNEQGDPGGVEFSYLDFHRSGAAVQQYPDYEDE